jgi:hypothetical protein
MIQTRLFPFSFSRESSKGRIYTSAAVLCYPTTHTYLSVIGPAGRLIKTLSNRIMHVLLQKTASSLASLACDCCLEHCAYSKLLVDVASMHPDVRLLALPNVERRHGLLTFASTADILLASRSRNLLLSFTVISYLCSTTRATELLIHFPNR